MTLRQLYLLGAALALTGCAGRGVPAAETVVVPTTVEVARPCPVVAPTRPAPLGVLPTALRALVATLGAKLKEYASPGGYADRAEEVIRICQRAGR